jgi:hypothetical protein
MAHFAELDDNNLVTKVIVVNNNELLDENGNESEQKGIAFCQNLFGGRWIQTSYNNNFRTRFAGLGMIYDPVRDSFYYPQPYPSWVFDEATHSWISPKERPGMRWTWDEQIEDWIPPVN